MGIGQQPTGEVLLAHSRWQETVRAELAIREQLSTAIALVLEATPSREFLTRLRFVLSRGPFDPSTARSLGTHSIPR